MIVQPIARPSSPSVRFTAFDENVITSITNTTKGTKPSHHRFGIRVSEPMTRSGRTFLRNGTISLVE